MSVDTSFLKTVTLFEDLSEEELGIVASRFRERDYVKHEIVFFEEDTGNYMYIVQEGRVKVSRLLPNGKEMILAFHEAREYFGEMSLIDGGTSPATVTTVIPSRVLTVTRENFLELLEHPSINRAVLKMLCGRCRDAWGQIEVLTFHNADARIRTALYQLLPAKGGRDRRRRQNQPQADSQRARRHHRDLQRNRHSSAEQHAEFGAPQRGEETVLHRRSGLSGRRAPAGIGSGF